jgi:hypothetical protein
MSEAKAKKQEQPKTPPKDFIIRHGDLKLFEFTNNLWRCVAPSGCTPQDLENPAIWSPVAKDLAPYDTIKVIAHDQTWYAELLVLDSLTTFARIKVLNVINLPPRLSDEEKAIPLGYNIRRADVDDAQGGWVVEREEDGHMLARGLPDYEAARRALVDHAIFKNDTQTKYLP